ncbi:hypothetical protein MXB_5033, partial [Myxobolus squamalis]
IIEKFNINCQQYYSYIINGFVLYSDRSATLFLKKLIAIIVICTNFNFTINFRETKLIENIWQAIQSDNQELIGAILKLTLNLYSTNCTLLEIHFLSKIALAALEFMRIQENPVSHIFNAKVLKNSSCDETQSDDHRQESSESFHMRYDLDATNIHPLRPIYVKFFDV